MHYRIVSPSATGSDDPEPMYHNSLRIRRILKPLIKQDRDVAELLEDHCPSVTRTPGAQLTAGIADLHRVKLSVHHTSTPGARATCAGAAPPRSGKAPRVTPTPNDGLRGRRGRSFFSLIQKMMP